MAIKAQDTFTEASNTFLESHTPDIGTGWTTDEIGKLQVDAAIDKLKILSAPGTSAREGTDIGTDQIAVEANLLAGSVSNGNGPQIKARMPSDGHGAYRAIVQGDLGGNIDVVLDRTSPSFVELGRFDVNAAASTTFLVRLEIRDSSKKVFVDGIERISSSDDELNGNQFAGLSMSALTASRIDNWKSEDLPFEKKLSSFFQLFS